MSDDDGFIGLPPGVEPNADSGTLRRDRTERPRRERDEIVFFPAAPGIPPLVPTTEPEAVDAATAVPETVEPQTAEFGPADADTVHPGAISTETVVPEPPVQRPAIDDATVVKPSRRAVPTWRLVIEGLDAITVEGVLYLGRKPVVGAEHPQARLLAVDDEARSVSKTHAMLEVDADALWVHDLHSTNGVWVVPAGEEAIEVTPGERALVPAGSELELGDFVIQIERG